MSELAFACVDSRADTAAAAPSIALRLRITEPTGVRVHAIALRTQVRIEPRRRRYDEHEAQALQDLFGERARWGDTQQPLQLAFVSHVVPTFTGETEFDLALPCSYDFDVAAHKYLYSLADGEIPLLLLFSGTVFTAADGGFTVAPIGWHNEARYRLPTQVWRQTMALHFPNTAWLRLSQDSFDALYRYRADHALISWDTAVERLLKEAGR